jgi:uncharacterized protein YqeY
MNLLERVENDLKDAMRARAADRLSVLRMLKAALKNAAIEKGNVNAVLDDTEAAAVIRKELKKRQDAVEGFRKGGREELATKELEEAEVLKAYLPQPFSAEEISALVREAVAEAGATTKQQMGAVMKIATAKAAGRADGKALSQEVQRQLA